MSKLTAEKIDAMSKAELHRAAKVRGIKYGKLSLLQIRDALKANPDEPVAKASTVAKKKAEPLPVTDDGHTPIRPTSKKKGAAAKKKTEKKPRKGKDGGASKMSVAMELYKENKNLPRKQILAIFQEKAKLTKAGSATYYGLITKKLG
jgi:hypothetical protein